MSIVEQHAIHLLEKARHHDRTRKILAILLILVLLVIAGKFILDLIPRHYVLTISGGNILSQRHFLVKLLQEEAEQNHVALKILKTEGSLSALEEVNEGKLDLAVIQGGIDGKYPNVTHVATLAPELIHFLAKPNIKDIKDFKGVIINMGERSEGTSTLAHQILSYSNLKANSDYVETNYSDEQLIGMRTEKLPDVIVEVSYAPSDLADYLVKKKGYRLIEMSFPPSLAKRLGWVADMKLLGYMYSIVPAVPPNDIQVVGVNLHLVANKNVNPRAISALLKTLYAPRLQNRFGNPISEADLLIPSGFPISSGTELYLASKQPIITDTMVDKIKALFGLLMTLASIGAVVWRWFKAPRDEDFQYEMDGDSSKSKH
jgi:TRAP-type uncharacterized transport system substrate-binding protein